jgi:hypothetical protein
VWRFFDWQANVPDDAFIEFWAQTVQDPDDFVSISPAPAAVGSSDVVFLGAATAADPAGWVGSEVSQALADEGITSQRYLKITMRFHASSTANLAPVLHDWRQAYSCLPAQ